MTKKEALDRLKKQYDRQNDFIKNNYDRVSVTLPQGTKERIRAYNEKPNTLISRLVMDWLKRKDDQKEAL